jgi:hypothetical protein
MIHRSRFLADRIYRATCHRFTASLFLFWRDRLFENVRMATLVHPEVLGSSTDAVLRRDAPFIHKIFSWHVLLPLLMLVGHRLNFIASSSIPYRRGLEKRLVEYARAGWFPAFGVSMG